MTEMSNTVGAVADVSKFASNIPEINKHLGEFTTADINRTAGQVADFSKFASMFAGEDSKMSSTLGNVGKAAGTVSEMSKIADILPDLNKKPGEYNVSDVGHIAGTMSEFGKIVGNLSGTENQFSTKLSDLNKTSSAIADVSNLITSVPEFNKQLGQFTAADLSKSAGQVTDLCKLSSLFTGSDNEPNSTFTTVEKVASNVADVSKIASNIDLNKKTNEYSICDLGNMASSISELSKVAGSFSNDDNLSSKISNIGQTASTFADITKFSSYVPDIDKQFGEFSLADLDKTAHTVQDFTKVAGLAAGPDSQAAATMANLGMAASTLTDVGKASSPLTDLKNKEHYSFSDLGVAAEAVADMSKVAGGAPGNQAFGNTMMDVGKAAHTVSDFGKQVGSMDAPQTDFSDFSKGVTSINDIGQKATGFAGLGKNAAAMGNFEQGVNAFGELDKAGNKLSELSKAASKLDNVNFKNADFSNMNNAANTLNNFGKSASQMAEFAKTASTLANFQEGVNFFGEMSKNTESMPDLGNVMSMFGALSGGGGGGGGGAGGGNPLMNILGSLGGGGGTGGAGGGAPSNPLANIGSFLSLIQSFSGGGGGGGSSGGGVSGGVNSSAAQNVGGFGGFGGLGSVLGGLASGGFSGILDSLGKVFSFLGLDLSVFKQIFPPNIKGSAARPSSWRPSPVPSQTPQFLPVSPVPGVVPVPGKDFKSLRDKCLQEGRLYEDPDFPACDQALFFSKRPPKSIQWRRPGELVRDPRLFVEGASRFDVQQGELGDCWLLAAVANLTLYNDIFHRVVPQDQSFKEGYAGIFHFQFWQYGQWIDVIIDDRLPTSAGELVYLHSKDRNEFWSALLEKAYAKLSGSYEALKGGSTNEAMEDFTGGLTEMFDLTSPPANLLMIMQKAFDRSSLMGCSIEPDPNVVEAELPNGLIRGHAYSITGFKVVDVKTPRSSGKIPLIRIRNPWGNEAEWKGAWGDQSPEWRCVSNEERQALGLVFDDDGEFWMSFQDFAKNFTKLEICNLSPDSLTDDPNTDKSRKKWVTQVYKGSWVRGCSAGGCRNFLQTFAKNPQFCVTLQDPDEDDQDDQCTAIISLMQLGRRRLRQVGQDLLTIGFAVYEITKPDPSNRPLGVDFFKYNQSVGRSPSFINLREVTARFKLPPGSYVIVPSTFEPNDEGEFLLRAFSEQKNLMDEFDEPTQFRDTKEQIPPEVTPQDQEFEDGMERLFTKLAGEDMQVDALELQEILNFSLKKEFTFDGFSTETCRSMVAMLDVDHSGRLELAEFKELWKHIRHWKTIFKVKDVNRSGSVNSFELREALHDAGYLLSNQVLKVLTLRYAQKDGTVTFDDFIMCAVKLRTIIEEFKARDLQKVDRATFTMQEWIEITMYS